MALTKEQKAANTLAKTLLKQSQDAELVALKETLTAQGLTAAQISTALAAEKAANASELSAAKAAIKTTGASAVNPVSSASTYTGQTAYDVSQTLTKAADLYAQYGISPVTSAKSSLEYTGLPLKDMVKATYNIDPATGLLSKGTGNTKLSGTTVKTINAAVNSYGDILTADQAGKVKALGVDAEGNKLFSSKVGTSETRTGFNILKQNTDGTYTVIGTTASTVPPVDDGGFFNSTLGKLTIGAAAALTGGALAPAIAGALGTSTAVGGAIGGGLAGATGAGLTGGNILQGAALGAAGGGLAGGLGGTATDYLGTAPLGDATTGAVGLGNTGFGLGAGGTTFGINTATAAGVGGYLGSGALADTLASISGLPTSTVTNTLGNTVANIATNAVGSLLGGVAGSLPGTVAGIYGANQYANTLQDYANSLNKAAQQFGTNLTTNVGNIAAGLPTAATNAGNRITDVAGTQAGLLTSVANQAGTNLVNVANQQAGQTTALAGQLAPTMQFNPVAMTTRFGSTTTPQYDANGKLIGYGYNVASDIAAQRDRLLALSNQALPTTTDVGQATTNYYNELQALQNPQREQQLAALRAQLQTTGRGGLAFGATTGTAGANALAATNPELAAYYNALAQQQSAQALTAQDIAQQRLNQQLALSSDLFGQAQTLEGAGQQALTLGTNLGSLATQGATNAANLQMNAQQVAAAQQISAQLQASGWDVQAANNAAVMQVQAETNAAQMQNQAAINQANLNAEAQRLASLQQLSAAQTGAGLLSIGAQAQNTAIQQGLAGVTPAVGSILQPIGNAVGGWLSELI